MRTLTAVLLLLFLSGCANNQPRIDSPIAHGHGTIAEPIEQAGNGIAVGQLQPQVGLHNEDTKNTAGGSINEAGVIESGYRSMAVMVLCFCGVLVVGFGALVLILVRGNQRHTREMLKP